MPEQGQPGEPGEPGRAGGGTGGVGGTGGTGEVTGGAGGPGGVGGTANRHPALRSIRAIASVALLLAAASVLLVAVLFKIYTDVRADSRNQTCAVFERAERTANRGIVNTYGFLDRRPDPDPDTSLTREVIMSLNNRYEEAQATKAPLFCAEPGIGLAAHEIPELPKRRNFDHLLKR